MTNLKRTMRKANALCKIIREAREAVARKEAAAKDARPVRGAGTAPLPVRAPRTHRWSGAGYVCADCGAIKDANEGAECPGK